MSRLKNLKEKVLEANLELVNKGLVLYTFGNVSEIDRELNVVAIKPSGVPYEKMKTDDIVIVDLTGKIIDGQLKPSSDLPTHLILYKKFKKIGGIAHTHSTYATAWAQAKKNIVCLGTTHADYVYGSVPCFVNSRLAGRGIPVFCESDIYGVLSEYVATAASDKVVTLLDINNSVPYDMI